jgi:hypothetical protein
MTFADLCNRHAGRPVLLVGTGPSLDRFPREFGGPRVLINRAAFVVEPRADDYWFVVDDAWGLGVPGPWHEHLGEVMAGNGRVAVFRAPLLARVRFVDPPAGPNVVHYGVARDRNREAALTLTREQVSARSELYERIGSAASALHLCWYLGASQVMTCGIDGGVHQADAVARHYRPNELGDYDTSRRYMLKAAGLLGLPATAI